MALFTFRDVSFTYPQQERAAFEHISFQIEEGAFVVLCGPSGSGKTTLLKHFKPILTPHGARTGERLFRGRPLEELSDREQAAEIGYVFQSPDQQIVTDKVWHELAFGLESLGYDNASIRRRVVEIATFFGIQNWFYKDIAQLSGGQKQLLNLAAIMTMQPQVVILDEPTSQLDPVAASDFLGILEKLHRELGTTILLIEQRLEEALPMADQVVVMGTDGQLLCDGTPQEVGRKLREQGNRMFAAMPTAMRIWAGIGSDQSCPVTVNEGRELVRAIAEQQELYQHDYTDEIEEQVRRSQQAPILLQGEELWFRYEQNREDVIKGLTLTLHQGEWLALLGGNGTGKTTALKVLSGIHKPYRGRIRCSTRIGYLPQNPQMLFVKKTVEADLREGLGITRKAEDERLEKVIRLCQLDRLRRQHPYDLSGGEQQRLGLAKVLLQEPEVLLLDEPTKGLDVEFKQELAEILKALLEQGIGILMVSHDVEFCAEHAGRCAMFFDGAIVAEDVPRRFFAGNSFYTTAANRIARSVLPQAILAEDVILACGGHCDGGNRENHEDRESRGNYDDSVGEMPVKKEEPVDRSDGKQQKKQRLPDRTKAALGILLVLLPLTLYMGMRTGHYNIASILILLECMLPFFLVFEGRKPKPRELVVIAVLCAIGVAGRAAFFMLPQFKPVLALTIIAGVAMGSETGFLVGAVTMLISNMLFSQGPWTPWQMFAMGISGFLAGLLFRTGAIPPKRVLLSIYGGLTAIIIYGGIMNPAAALIWAGSSINWKMIVSYYVSGFPMDCVHAFATIVFLLIAAEPVIEKLERMKIKYGMLEP